jgi:hypothetical protein
LVGFPRESGLSAKSARGAAAHWISGLELRLARVMDSRREEIHGKTEFHLNNAQTSAVEIRLRLGGDPVELLKSPWENTKRIP